MRRLLSVSFIASSMLMVVACNPSQEGRAEADEQVETAGEAVVAQRSPEELASSLLLRPPSPHGEALTREDLDTALGQRSLQAFGQGRSVASWETRPGVQAFAPVLRQWLGTRSPADQDLIFKLWATGAPNEAAAAAVGVLQSSVSEVANYYVAASGLARCGEAGVNALNALDVASLSVEAQGAISSVVSRTLLYPDAAKGLFGEGGYCQLPTTSPGCAAVAAGLAVVGVDVDWAAESANTALLRAEGEAIRTGDFSEWSTTAAEADLPVVEASLRRVVAYGTETLGPVWLRVLTDPAQSEPFTACRVLLRDAAALAPELEVIASHLAGSELSTDARVCLNAVMRENGREVAPELLGDEPLSDPLRPLASVLWGGGDTGTATAVLEASTPAAALSAPVPTAWLPVALSLWVAGDTARDALALDAVLQRDDLRAWEPWLARSAGADAYFEAVELEHLSDPVAFSRYASSRDAEEVAAGYVPGARGQSRMYLRWALATGTPLDTERLVQEIEGREENAPPEMVVVSNRELAAVVLLRQGGLEPEEALALRSRIAPSAPGFTAAGLVLAAARGAVD